MPETNPNPSRVSIFFHSWWRSVVFLLLINLGSLIGIFVLSNNVNKVASNLQKAREDAVKLGFQNQSAVVADELELYQSDAQKLNNLFLDDEGVFGFITKLDDLKSGGTISDFSIASDIVEKDKLGFEGVPISIDVTGTEAQINSALQQIYDLDVLLNPIYLEIIKVEGNTYTYKLGGFLYVSETFN